MKHILSYGGGINSTALFYYLLDNKIPLDLVIFADTGEEKKSTYETAQKIKIRCEYENIPFKTVKSILGNLYDYYYTHKIVMSIMRRDCTDKFKIRPIRKYLRKKYGKNEKFIMYIGITYEEAHRIKDSNVKYITNSFPFVKYKITRNENLKILKQNNIVAFKSACKGCVFTKKSEWINMIIHDPKEFQRHIALEKNNIRYPEFTLCGYSLEKLKESWKNQQDLSLFLDNEPMCNNINGGCFL